MRKPNDITVDIHQHLGLVGHVCRIMKSHGDPDEVRSAAMRGLFYASRFHDPSRGTFATYAVATMIGYVKTYRTKEARFRCLRRARRLILFSELGDRYFTGNRNLFAREPPEEFSDELDRLRNAMSKCPRRQQIALTLRYGLDGGDERTLLQVGEALGVSKERARQLIVKAEKKLVFEIGQINWDRPN